MTARAKTAEQAPAGHDTTRDLCRMIVDRHGLRKADHLPAEWAVFFELRNGTGYSRREQRYVDALAMNLYPSKKFWRVAYEVKASRADFLRELAQPDKRAWGIEISNEFYYVCPTGVAKPDEIPKGCGLLSPRNGVLARVVAAQQRDARPLAMDEIAAIARRSQDPATYRDVRWRYAGSELDETALEELARDRAGEMLRRECDDRARKWYDDRAAHAKAAILAAKEALKDAGLPPLPFMDPLLRLLADPNGHVGSPAHAEWQARDWVREHVFPGPEAREVAAALEEHRRIRHTLKRLSEDLDHAKDALDAEADAVGRNLEALAQRKAAKETQETP